MSQKLQLNIFVFVVIMWLNVEKSEGVNTCSDVANIWRSELEVAHVQSTLSDLKQSGVSRRSQ